MLLIGIYLNQAFRFVSSLCCNLISFLKIRGVFNILFYILNNLFSQKSKQTKSKQNPSFFYFFFFAFLFIGSQKAFCAQQKDDFIDWKVFSNIVDGEKYCYMVSIPVKKSSIAKNDTVSYFIISNNENVDEISISCGHEFKKNYDLELFVGLQKFFLMTYDNLSWTKDNYSDIEIIKEMMAVEKVTVYCISDKNRDSFHTYSLLGFKEAYYKMKDQCVEGII